MTEQLISLETAKLAKEKGFSVGSQNYYNLRYGDLRTCGGGKSGFAPETRPSNDNNIYAIAEAPTQSLLQKWLRDERGIIVWVRPGLDLKVFSWYLDGEEIPNRLNKNNYKSFEEALEAGLKEALTLLK